MAKPTGEITLAARPVKVGAQWHVVGTYPGGQQEHITGFGTEADALDWIANVSADWLEKRRVRAWITDPIDGVIGRQLVG
jgi:uncharacterized protein YjlB